MENNEQPKLTNRQKLELIATVAKTIPEAVGLALKQQALEYNMDYDELLETQYQTALKMRDQT